LIFEPILAISSFSSVTVRCGLLQIGDVIRHQLRDQLNLFRIIKIQKSYLPVFLVFMVESPINTTTTATATAVPSNKVTKTWYQHNTILPVP